MSDRYRYPPRPRSPTLNPARASLPINLSGFGHPAAHEHHLHVVPIGTSRREPTSSPGHSRSISSSNNAGTVTTTTYKINTDPPPPVRASSHTRNDSQTRRRSGTTENHHRPTGVTAATKNRPVVHGSGGRAPSPAMKNPYRSSEESYTVPAYSQHGHHHRHSVDNENLGRIAIDRDGNRLRIGSGRQEVSYHASRPRSMHPVPVARHADAAADNYGDDEYGYTNPRDLVTYDLNHPARSRPRINSFDEGSRPSSVSGYGELVPRPYDTRERRPPPTTRGLDRIPRGATWEQPATARMPVIAPIAGMDPVHRPAKVETYEQPPVRRSGVQRPVSLYHDRDRERRRDSRDEYYEARDEQPRPHRRDSANREVPRFENPIEQRGFGIRAEAPPPRPERPDRPEMSERVDRGDRPDMPERVLWNDRERSDRPERGERHERSERLDRPERSERAERERAERYDRIDRPERERSDRLERPERGERSERTDDRKDKSGRDLLATSLGIAGATLGLNSSKKTRDESRDARERDREDWEERDERRRKDYEDEPRRRREPREDRNSPDSSDREPKERRQRDEDRERAPPKPSRENGPPIPPKEPLSSKDQPLEAPRDMPPPRDLSPKKENAGRERRSDPLVSDLSRHNSKERPSSRSGRPARDSDPELRESRRRDGPGGPDESPSQPVGGFHHQRPVKESVASPTAFNPKDTMDLKALKEALNQQENTVPKEKAPAPAPKISRSSIVRDAAEVEAVRNEFKEERRSREPLDATKNPPQPRVVSPPRQKVEDKPVKGILRQPREKFPEDPSPIREGVAPLKDAKKDGVPPNARWTKISRNLVNPEALELGKERYEARDDFVIVLRVLSRDEVQGYADVTQKLRAAREDAEEEKSRDERRRARRERHERHKHERSRGERTERTAERPRRRREREPRDSESDTTDDDMDAREREPEKPKMLALEPAPSHRRALSNSGGSTGRRFEDVMMSGGLGSGPPPIENPNIPGQYLNYTRNPPLPSALVAQTTSTSRRDRD